MIHELYRFELLTQVVKLEVVMRAVVEGIEALGFDFQPACLSYDEAAFSDIPVQKVPQC